MSPILVRPVREQLEHDRVIRLLQAKYKRKFEVAINPGNEQTMPVGAGPSAWYPDLVLQSADRAHKLAGVVEVETTESVNNLEAMSQWRTFARLRVPFHLYLPSGSVDSARRFCVEFDIPVAEMWAYQAVGDQLRFTLVQKVPQSSDGREPRARAASEVDAVVEKPVKAAAATKPAAEVVRPRPAAAPRRAATAPRPNGSSARPAAPRRSATAPATRRTEAKAKKAAPTRRPAAAAKAPARRKAKTGVPSRSTRAQKRK